jgi:hypothetical protein
MAITDWSTTPGSNTSAPPNGAPEGMLASLVNNVIRQVMADVRAHAEDGGWLNRGDSPGYASATSFTMATDLTSIYGAGHRVRAVGSSTGTIYGTIDGSTYADPTTTVVVTFDSGSLQNESLAISVGIDREAIDNGVHTGQLHHLQSYAAMTALTTPADDDKCVLWEDNIAGHFEFEAGSSDTANLGTIFDADDATTGQWVRFHDGPVQAHWFLDEDHASTDQTANLQNAIDYTESIVGVLELPPGTVRIDSQLTIDIDLCSVKGLGTLIDATNMTTGYLFSVTGSDDDIADERKKITRFVSDIIATGPGDDSTTDFLGLIPGATGTMGAGRCSFDRLYATSFRNMISIGKNAFLNSWTNCGFVDYTYGLYCPETLDTITVTNAGERMVFRSCLFGGNAGIGQAIWAATSIECFFTHCSFDTLEKVVNLQPGSDKAARINLDQCHMEAVNDNGWTTSPSPASLC